MCRINMRALDIINNLEKKSSYFRKQEHSQVFYYEIMIIVVIRQNVDFIFDILAYLKCSYDICKIIVIIGCVNPLIFKSKRTSNN